MPRRFEINVCSSIYLHFFWLNIEEARKSVLFRSKEWCYSSHVAIQLLSLAHELKSGKLLFISKVHKFLNEVTRRGGMDSKDTTIVVNAVEGCERVYLLPPIQDLRRDQRCPH